ncbi:hypothetical protein FQN60_005859 [Etheostoma spectabile]|uniref:Uncharacterized protein n=1 Tax=Etheostoma spectabile TaxID=54343 RepID=A0A5J5CEF8_9PERO|nr:hypothetical protein FQN60_005859 [Etheostoma spectabile]
MKPSPLPAFCQLRLSGLWFPPAALLLPVTDHGKAHQAMLSKVKPSRYGPNARRSTWHWDDCASKSVNCGARDVLCTCQDSKALALCVAQRHTDMSRST